MSRLSFRLLLLDVFADLHFVFLFGIFVGNFIFSFLLFSCREEEDGQEEGWRHHTGATTACSGGTTVSTTVSTLAVELALVNNLELLLG